MLGVGEFALVILDRNATDMGPDLILDQVALNSEKLYLTDMQCTLYCSVIPVDYVINACYWL